MSQSPLVIELVFYGLLTFVLGACVLALAKGSVGERIAAGVILGNLVVGTANNQFFHNEMVDLFAVDGLTALILLGVAVRYASLWLGAVMLLYGLQFGLHAYYIVLERPLDDLYKSINNGVLIAVSLCLVLGTIVAWRQRIRIGRTLQTAP